MGSQVGIRGPIIPLELTTKWGVCPRESLQERVCGFDQVPRAPKVPTSVALHCSTSFPHPLPPPHTTRIASLYPREPHPVKPTGQESSNHWQLRTCISPPLLPDPLRLPRRTELNTCCQEADGSLSRKQAARLAHAGISLGCSRQHIPERIGSAVSSNPETGGGLCTPFMMMKLKPREEQ